MFYPSRLLERAKANIQKHPWAAGIRERLVDAAQPWLSFSDDELWHLMFGATLRRSWMVWSNGHCPSCRAGVPMYDWKIDALKHPWKVRCPHCQEFFPRNDFHAFYRSGLDAHNVFDSRRADRSLLFNSEHPDPADPLRGYGVDDGEGYVEGDKRWRFIGAYLIYGQWKQAVVAGIRYLAAAYTVTGDPCCAHKAVILLDRVADLYPTFDFGKPEQGVMYEGPPHAGYVSTWHDACEETREMVLAWDQVREAIQGDQPLVAFLSQKAAQFRLDNPKRSCDDIRRNIEDRILRDALANRHRIHSNYPRTEIALMVILSVLDWPGNRADVISRLDEVIARTTAVDGVTGEKGLAGYTAYTISGFAGFLAMYSRVEPEFLAELVRRHPRLRETWRFHIDTWCSERYYPQSGDTGSFAARSEHYAGATFARPGSLEPSMFSFFYELYRLTGDPAFVQVLYHENDAKTDGLPHDLFAEDSVGFRREVAEVIAREGAAPKLGSLNKQEWHLAILRGGKGDHERALWLDYDSGERHSHADGMNLGLFARGLDLMPDFGYPPVQFGGWGSPRSRWYMMTAAHNTVVVDGSNQPQPWKIPVGGKTLLWIDRDEFRAIRASAPELVGTWDDKAERLVQPQPAQYERTAAMVKLSERDFYVVDIFRVVGGARHDKFFHSHFGRMTTRGLTLSRAPDYGSDTQMRSFRVDHSPVPGWSADWEIEDRLHYLPAGARVGLRYTDLTPGAEAFTCEGWIVVGGYEVNEEVWIPRLMVRRRAEASAGAPLASTFVAVIEPHDGESRIASIRRLPLVTADGRPYADSNVAIEVGLADGRADLFISADAENALGLRPSLAADTVLVQKDWGIRLEGELCLARRNAAGGVDSTVACGGRTSTLS